MTVALFGASQTPTGPRPDRFRICFRIVSGSFPDLFPDRFRICFRIVSGSTRKDGYAKIRVNGKPHYAHRLVYLYHHGTMPEVIDHIDGNPANNRIENLRPADMRQNQGNRRKSQRGLLPKGVDWKPSIGKWQARITVDGRQVYLGVFDTAEIAHAAYVEAARRYFGEFARSA